MVYLSWTVNLLCFIETCIGKNNTTLVAQSGRVMLARSHAFRRGRHARHSKVFMRNEDLEVIHVAAFGNTKTTVYTLRSGYVHRNGTIARY